MSKLTAQEIQRVREWLDEEEARLKPEIPKGTPGYASSIDPNEKGALRYFSHMEGDKFACFHRGEKEGKTLSWKYFTPLQETILGILHPHDGEEYKGHPDDFVWARNTSGLMSVYATVACGVVWADKDAYYLIKRGG